MDLCAPQQELLRARRLARVIGQDMALYNADKLASAIAEDRLFEAFADDMREAWLTYRSRLPAHVDAEGHTLRAVLCEVLLGAQGHIVLPMC